MVMSDTASLYTLGDRGETVDGSANDIRGREVKDQNLQPLGKVADLLVDDRENKVRFLLVEHGGFIGIGQTTTLIPVDAVTEVSVDEVHVDQSRDRVAAAPGYTPDLVNDRNYQSTVYKHYGYPPYWGVGYMYPGGWGTRV